MRTLTLAPLVSALVLSAAPLGAQLSAAASLGGIVQRDGIDSWQSATRFDPAIRADGRWAQFGADATVLGSSGDLRLAHGRFDILAEPAPFGPFRLSTSARVERLSVTAVNQRDAGRLESALSVRFSRGGGWFGVAAEGANGIDSAVVRPLLGFGIWRQLGSLLLTVSSESHAARLGGRAPTVHTEFREDTVRDSLTGGTSIVTRPRTFGDSGSASSLRLWSDLQARLGWATDWLSIDAKVGARPKLDAAPATVWAQGVATIAVTPRLSIVAAGGRRPAQAWLGAPAGRFASFGLRFAPAAFVRPAPAPQVRPTADALDVRPADDGNTIITLRVPNARTVEISGDFNGWHPIPMRAVRPDVWQTTLALGPRTYRVNVRVNGDRWTAPPGLPTANDDYNGTVGLLVIR